MIKADAKKGAYMLEGSLFDLIAEYTVMSKIFMNKLRDTVDEKTFYKALETMNSIIGSEEDNLDKVSTIYDAIVEGLEGINE